LVREGMILYYGVCVENVDEALMAFEYPNVKSVNFILNMLRHRPTELFFGEARRRKVGILARVPLASGLLTGKMNRQTAFSESDHRQFNRHGEAFDMGETFSGVDYDTGIDAVEAIRAVLPADATLAQFALRWILMFDAVSCAIPGAKRPTQVEDNVNASSLPSLTDHQMQVVKDVYDRMIRPLVHHRW
ncbi:MAG: aldo/keto reductase, partial [Anaerolineae bacterium]|nr:aldo/keto reductase [Anaerolineae bacterium]